MSSERTFDVSPHRFFRAMVLMGSGIALGCGGISEDTAGAGGTNAQGGTAGTTGGTGTGGDVSGTGGTGGTGTGGDVSTTGGTGTGGSSISVTGGTGGTTGGSSTGGSISVTGGTGGTTGGTGGTTGGTAGIGGNGDCPSSQWTCAGYLMCGGGTDVQGYVLPSNCSCDITRPLSGAECASGRRACLEATLSADGTPLSPAVPVECSCAPDPTSCATSCHAVFPDGDGHFCSDIVTKRLPLPPPQPAEDDILCGCSFVYLK